MTVSHKPLFVSIFYSQEEWFKFIRDGLNPFLLKAFDIFEFSYIIYFSSDRGHNIGLIINIEKESAHAFISLLHRDFSTYILRNKSIPSDSYRQEVPLFMDFPNNSIQYGIQGFLPQNDQFSLAFEKLWQQSSRILADELGKEKFTLDDLCTIAIYLNLSLILSNNSFYQIRKANYSPDNISADHELLLKDVRSKYDENQDSLQDILRDCYAIVSGTMRTDLRWIAEWLAVFNEFIKGYLEDNSSNGNLLYKTISMASRKQLGINMEGMFMIDYFIHRLLDIQVE